MAEEGPREFTFRFDGTAIPARSGDSLGSALHRAGVRVLARSIKYHRPRGLFCGTGHCGNCLVRVNGEPNARACVTPAAPGARVRSQNAFPNASFDLFSIVDKVYRRKFDVHDRFIRPGFMRPVYNGVIRRMAGFGNPPDPTGAAPERPPIARASPDVCVVGGGASGLAAAVAAAETGVDVLLLEESPLLGGRLRYETRALPPSEIAKGNGPETLEALVARASAAPNLRIETGRGAVGVYRDAPAEEPVREVEGTGAFDGLLVAMSPAGLLEATPRALVVATGANDTLQLFPGNDLPGVMSLRCALRLLHDHDVSPGSRLVVSGLSERAALFAEQARERGLHVLQVQAPGEALPGSSRDARPAARIARAVGGRRVRRVVLHEAGRETKHACDAVVLAHAGAPRIDLLQQADCRLRHDDATGAIVPVLLDHRASAAGVFACGEAAGAKSATAALTEGWNAGLAAARSVGG